MNIATIAMCLLAYRMLNNNSASRANTSNTTNIGSGVLDSMLSDEAKNIMGSVRTLTNGDGDKTGALLSILTNPSVMSVVSSMFGGVLDNIVNFGRGSSNDGASNSSAEGNSETSDGTTDSDSNTSPYSHNATTDNREYDTTPYYGGTEGAHQFFAPVDNIAGTEVASKLYHMYDNYCTHT